MVDRGARGRHLGADRRRRTSSSTDHGRQGDLSSDAFFRRSDRPGSRSTPSRRHRTRPRATSPAWSPTSVSAMATAASDLNRAAGRAPPSLPHRGAPQGPAAADPRRRSRAVPRHRRRRSRRTADQLTHMEFVAFHRDHPGGASTTPAPSMGSACVFARLEDGPDAKHGGTKEVAPARPTRGRSSYDFDVDRDGNLVRWSSAMPSFDELLVVSIRPDSYEVYPIDPVLAADVAEKAIEGHRQVHRSVPGQSADDGQPGRWPADNATDAAGTHRTRQRPAPPEPTTAPEGGPADADKVVALLERARSHAAVAATVNRWVRDGPSARRLAHRHRGPVLHRAALRPQLRRRRARRAPVLRRR